jgi:SAM-dependent methyltransferase
MLVDRGFAQRNKRIQSVDAESYQDFMLGFRGFTYGKLDQAARARATDILEDLRLNNAELPLEAFKEKFDQDPLIATRVRCWLSSQQLMWQSVLDHYEQHEEHYLAELADCDTKGPGSLELNTGMDIPDYAQHEFHIQPGGYTGHDFAGALYHYGTNTFYAGQNDEDQFQIAIANEIALPADGQVKRIVDLGCGIGRLTAALAEKFPEAETWGLDVGGPLVRYAHKRAIDLNIPVHFAQRKAEDTKFEADSFDLVTAYILFHEVSPEAARDICAEAFRILRPGGVFDVTDFHTGKAHPTDPYFRYFRWVDHVYNAERWAHKFVATDFFDTLRSVGFEVEQGENRHWGIGVYIARKPA